MKLGCNLPCGIRRLMRLVLCAGRQGGLSVLGVDECDPGDGRWGETAGDGGAGT